MSQNFCSIFRGKLRLIPVPIIFYQVERKATKSNVLRQIKHEYERRNVLSTDILVDAQATKTLCEALSPSSNSNCLQGFVQLIIQDPFGMLFLSDMQVRYYFNLCF